MHGSELRKGTAHAMGRIGKRGSSRMKKIGKGNGSRNKENWEKEQLTHGRESEKGTAHAWKIGRRSSSRMGRKSEKEIVHVWE